MKFLKEVLFIFLLMAMAPVYAQDSVTLRGKVLAENFEPLAGAAVYIQKYDEGVYTDSSGQFRFRLPRGVCEVSVSYIGYHTVQKSFALTHDTTIEVQMKTDLQLKEVVVVDKQQLKAADHTVDGVISLRKENFLSLPSMLGENDPIRAVEMQPGVQSGSEGANGIFIQGGSPDQTLISLDGATVYNPCHIYGVISVFNSDAIDRIDIYKNAYPAEFGGRLGSVLDITSSAGNNNWLTGSATVGVVTSRAHLEGPLDKSHNTTFSVSARGSFIGLFTLPISKRAFASDGVTGGVSYYFEDVQGRLSHRFSNKDELSWSFFENKDFYKYEDAKTTSHPTYNYINQYIQTVKWANYVSSLMWAHRFNEKWNWKNTFSFTDYNFTPGQQVNIDHDYFAPVDDYKNYQQYSEISNLRQFSLQSTAAYSNSIQTIKFGAGADEQQFKTGGGNQTTIESDSPYVTTVTPLYQEIVNAVDFTAFAQDEIKPVKGLVINVGVRAQDYYVQHKDFFSILPRFSIAYTPAKNFTIRSSVSGLSQDLHLLSPSDGAVLNDNWLPATSFAPPESGWNYAVGCAQKLPLNFEWSVDGFYRSMKNLIDYRDGADYSFETSSWEQQVVTGGVGRAYGVEAYVARSFGRITGSISYTLAWSERKFSELNQGNWYPYTYDRRHDVAIQANYLLNKHIEFGAAWVYGSGNMTTLPIAEYNSYSGVSSFNNNASRGVHQNPYASEITAYTPRNGYRMPSFQHLDISFTYKKRVKKLEHLFNVSIYNVYNHFNVFEIVSLTSTGSNGATVYDYKYLGLFPILPAISYTLKFGLR